jgi:cell division protein FtsQ
MLNLSSRSFPVELPLDVQLMQSTSRALMWGAILLLILLAAGWVSQHSSWAFRRIEIKGDLEHNGIASIRAHAVPLIKGNFFTLQLDQARKAFESVPWVREAKLRRVWPHTLEVELLEHQAVALWRGANNSSEPEGTPESISQMDGLVNNHGELFYANAADVEDEKLPQFIGSKDRISEMWQLYRELMPVLAPLGRVNGGKASADIAWLRLSPRGSWAVAMDNQVQIEMGRGTQAEILDRCQHFVTNVQRATTLYHKSLLYADLRHTQGYAVRLADINSFSNL